MVPINAGAIVTVGVFPGKFLPPHRGHVTGILRAHALCDELHVAVSERAEDDAEACARAGVRPIPGSVRVGWLQAALAGLGIRVMLVDEGAIAAFPEGWSQYADLLRGAIGKRIDVIFGGEPSYAAGHARHFPGTAYRLLDPTRSQWRISATEIRRDPIRHWDLILPQARPWFARRVLITGPESCGKTTLAQKLASIFGTTWSEEVGRVYQERELGGNGSKFVIGDFEKIARRQRAQDVERLASARRVCFFDTDAVVTKFFSAFFTGRVAPGIDACVDAGWYDLVLALKPTVPWVDDGTRDTGAQAVRDANFGTLMRLYREHGFDVTRFVIVDAADHLARLEQSIAAVNSLLAPREPSG